MQATIFDGRTSRALTLNEAVQANGQTAEFDWVDIQAASAEDPDAEAMLRALGFSDFQVSQAMRTDVAGTLMGYGHGILGVTWFAEGDLRNPAELHFFWSPKRLITLHFVPAPVLTSIQQRLADRARPLFDTPSSVPGVFLQLLLTTLNGQLTGLRSTLDDVDDAIIEKAAPSQLSTLRSIKASCTPLARRFPGYADAVSAALVDATTLPGMDDQGAQHLQTYGTQVQDTVQRLSDLADGIRSAMQDYQTEISNRQGERINQLTVVSIIFLPISFLTGYFGMNFQWLDNQILGLWSWLLLGVALPAVMFAASVLVLGRRGYSLRWMHSSTRNSGDSPPPATHPGGAAPTSAAKGSNLR